ncbi:TRAP transporter substrate-binding protein [Siminovitchia sediminis]|uniref:TRAP transporter substrate-binding protein n=1 Tax=Siminovitchia sediminis TaxID=1274353 RepID=A0ABW4KG00_9BACI
MSKVFKRLLFLSFLVLSVLMITACGSSGGSDSASGGSGTSEDPITLNYYHVAQENHPTHAVAVEYKEKVEELSEGRLQIEVFCCGQLYPSETDGAEATIKGDVDIAMSAAPAMSSLNSSFMVFDLPFLFKNEEQAYAALDGELGAALDKKLEEMGLVSIGWGSTGFKQLVSAGDPIESVEDLNGKRMRVMENKMHMDIFNSLGANASGLAFGEVYSALSQGTFDMLDSTAAYVISSSFYEVVDYFTVSNHFFHPAVTFINKEKFDSLPEDLQQILLDAGNIVGEKHRQLVTEQEKTDHQKMVDEGVEVIELSDEELKKFEEAVQPIYEKYESEIGKDLIDIATSYSE